MDKKIAEQKIRERLEHRIAAALGCQPSELPHMKMGSLVHFTFLLDGTSQTIGGFDTTMRALLDLLGHEIVWEIEPEHKAETPEGTVVH